MHTSHLLRLWSHLKHFLFLNHLSSTLYVFEHSKASTVAIRQCLRHMVLNTFEAPAVFPGHVWTIWFGFTYLWRTCCVFWPCVKHVMWFLNTFETPAVFPGHVWSTWCSWFQIPLKHLLCFLAMSEPLDVVLNTFQEPGVSPGHVWDTWCGF